MKMRNFDDMNIAKETFAQPALETSSESNPVLFVCTGNSCRSVMAQHFFEMLCRKEGLLIPIQSAGTHAPKGMPPTPNTLALMRRYGIAAEDHKAEKLTAPAIYSAQTVVCMEEKHLRFAQKLAPAAPPPIHLLADFYPEADPVLKLTGIPDPLGMSSQFYEDVCAIILKCCQGLLKELLNGVGTRGL